MNDYRSWKWSFLQVISSLLKAFTPLLSKFDMSNVSWQTLFKLFCESTWQIFTTMRNIQSTQQYVGYYSYNQGYYSCHYYYLSNELLKWWHFNSDSKMGGSTVRVMSNETRLCANSNFEGTTQYFYSWHGGNIHSLGTSKASVATLVCKGVVALTNESFLSINPIDALLPLFNDVCFHYFTPLKIYIQNMIF